jgi:hypothetical protein
MIDCPHAVNLIMCIQAIIETVSFEYFRRFHRTSILTGLNKLAEIIWPHKKDIHLRDYFSRGFFGVASALCICTPDKL